MSDIGCVRERQFSVLELFATSRIPFMCYERHILACSTAYQSPCRLPTDFIGLMLR